VYLLRNSDMLLFKYIYTAHYQSSNRINIFHLMQTMRYMCVANLELQHPSLPVMAKFLQCRCHLA
jgi:hypothetical protein